MEKSIIKLRKEGILGLKQHIKRCFASEHIVLLYKRALPSLSFPQTPVFMLPKNMMRTELERVCTRKSIYQRKSCLFAVSCCCLFICHFSLFPGYSFHFV